jgi:hypothetical protein
MDNFLEVKIPFRRLAGILRDDFARSVAEEALRLYFQEGDSEAKSALKVAIREHITVPGFRRGKSHLAPAPLLRQAVVEEWHLHEDMVRAVFRLWLETRKDLAGQVGAALREGGLPTEGMAGDTLTGYWKWEEFQAWVDRIREMLPEEDEDEIRLSIALLTGRLPVSDQAYETIAKISLGEEEMALNFWTRILQEMRNLPAEAPEWETLEEFLEEARAIGEEKRRERWLQDQRIALQQAVETFCAKREERIRFFQMDRCADWSVEACVPERVEEALRTLQELGTRMDQYEDLYNLRPATVAERREWQRQLDVLEEQVLTLYAQLNEYLTVQEEMLPPVSPLPEEGAAVAVEEKREEVPAVERVPEVEEEVAEEVSAVPEVEEEVAEEVSAIPEVEEERMEELPPGVEEAAVFEAEGVPEGIPPAPEVPEGIPPVLEVPEEVPPSRVEEETGIGAERITPAAVEVVVPPAEEIPAEKEANRLLVSLLGENDVLTGYWLAWAMEYCGLKPVIRSSLIGAVQGAFWAMRLWPDRPSRMMNDLRDIAQHTPEGLSRAEQWVAAAAALYLALVAPTDGWGDWLVTPMDKIPALAELAETVRRFASLGWVLQPEDMESVRGREEREGEIRRIAEDARRWLESAPRRSTTYQRASAVWRRMTSPPDGDLYQWFVIVARDQRKHEDQVRQALEDWRRDNWVDDRIQEIDLELVGRRLSSIEGTARRQIIRWAGEACEQAERWLQAIWHERQVAQQREWLQEQLRLLLRSFNQSLPLIDEQIRDALRSLPEGEERAAMHLLGQSVLLLKRVFSLPGGTDTPVEFRFDLPSSIFRERSFQQNLAYRLLWLPEASVIDMSDSGEILFREQYAGTLVRVLLDSSLRDRSPEKVLDQWLNLRDYRFVDEFLALAPILEEVRRILEARSREALRSDLSALHTERRESIVAVEQALIDGLISEGERTSYIGRIEAVGKDLNRVEYHLEANRWLLNLGSLSERLQNVRKELDEKRRNRLEGQRQRWVDLRTRLAGAVPATDFRAIQQKLESALERGEIRVVDEYLASLEEALKGKELPIGLFAPGGKRDRLREFRDAIHPLSEFLNSYSVEKIIRDVVQGKPPAELDLPRLPASRMREIARALFAWSSLKANRSEEHQTDHVIALMEYLGFRTQGSSPVALIQTPGVRQSGLRHWRVRAVPGGTNLVPVPQFGSEREGQYDVIGIWDRPGFNLMSALVDQTVDRPTIVFYFGRLLLRQREDLLHSEELRSLKVPVLILDEILLLFLAREYDIRLGTFFACTLPFTFLNPYVPFAAGAVPPEMFVGRREMVQQLLDPRGPAIVYGGRQLGKSALLRQVWREFHNPGMGKYAILEDIKSLGGPLTGLDYERAFWERVAHRLDVEGFLDVPPNISPKTLQDRIQRRIAEQNLRLMLLLDEADNFLEADAERGFPVVSDLKRLMDGTERRFKVVFAGLHNVQRFQRIPNQPLAHLGTPIEVGPLEPEAAWELLERPLQALGYRFGEGLKEEDPSIPFLIFSYTNYHPGLIQLFGWELVRRLKATRRSGLPPFGISRSDVEAVYRNEEVRKNIRERFTWTLSLDERYEAIALAMILDQWEDRNGFDRFYNHREIQDLVSVFWRDGFEGMESDQFQGYLSEMCGLGVLIQEGGRYRLRSPNVVQLLGTYESLWDRLIEISKKPAPSRLRLESHHALLGESAYSPLSYAQESALKMSRTGVGMVFGSDALGIGHLKEATRRFVEHRQHWEEIRIQPRSGDALVRWLSGQLKYERPSALRVFFRDLDASLWTPEELEEQIQAAVKFASGRSMLRIIFSLGPLTAWRWFQLPSDRREGIEEKAGTIVSIRPLDLLGIQQRLEQHKPELIATERNCRRIREVTGGWPFLVEELLRRCRAERTDDPMPVLDRFEEDLSDPNCDVRRKFIERLQIPSDTPFRVVQAFLREQSVNGGEEYWVPRDLAHMLLEDENPERVSAAIDYLVRMAVLRERLGESKARLKKPEKEVSLDPIIYRLWTV